MIPDSVAQNAMSLLSDGLHVKLQGAGHDLGLGDWNVALLLCALTSFLDIVSMLANPNSFLRMRSFP